MRILQLLAHGHVGGTETFAISLVKGLNERGHHAVLANAWTDSTADAPARAAGIPFAPLRAGTYRIGWKWMGVVGHYLRSNRFDIVQTYGLRASLAVRLMQRRVGIVHHVTGVRGLDQQRTGVQAFLDRRTEHRLDMIICNAQAVAARRMALVGTPAHRIRVIPNGIDVSYFQTGVAPPPRDALGLPGGFLFATVASFRAEKDHANLLDAIVLAGDELADVGFVFIGAGRLQADVWDRVREKNLIGRVRFIAPLQDVRDHVRSCDAFVLPSSSEGMPRALMEAMALGKPVIATDAGGIPEVARDDHEAILAPARDPRALAEAMIRIRRDAALRARLSSAAVRRIRDHFSHTAMFEQHIRVYEGVLQSCSDE
ncbi:MAG: glycosyltransferase family 4 protein [Phycisphaerales bacterium]|nr:glycosyltransferase family 4 protein [Phycisphaerales bacterium]